MIKYSIKQQRQYRGRLRHRVKLVTVARDVRNAGRDYQIREAQAKSLFEAGLLAWSPDSKCYIDDNGVTYNAIRQGKYKEFLQC